MRAGTAGRSCNLALVAGILGASAGCCALTFRPVPPAVPSIAAPVANGPWTTLTWDGVKVLGAFTVGTRPYLAIQTILPSTPVTWGVATPNSALTQWTTSRLPQAFKLAGASNTPSSSGSKTGVLVLDAAVVVSLDEGQTWRPTPSLAPGYVPSPLAIRTKQDSLTYTAAAGPLFLIATGNRRESRQLFVSRAPLNGWSEGLVFDFVFLPANSPAVAEGKDRRVAYDSSAGAWVHTPLEPFQKWRRIPIEAAGERVQWLDFAPASDDLHVVVVSANGSQFCRFAAAASNTWTRTGCTPSGLDTVRGFSHFSAQRLLLIGLQGASVSTDGGATFTRTFTAQAGVESVTAGTAFSASEALLVTTEYAGGAIRVFHSNDGGGSWRRVQ